MEVTQLIEPTRKTLLDVLKANLKAAGRTTYVHRLIYIGEHRFIDGPATSIGDCVEKTIQKVNNGYNDEHLSGILLWYTKYFCHIIEGSEDSIIKHLTLFTCDPENRSHLGKLKLLVCYHHINQRFLPGWIAVSGKPPALLERIDVNSDLEKTSRRIYHCVQKLYKLALLQRSTVVSFVDINTEALQDFCSATAVAQIETQSNLSQVTDPLKLNVMDPECLPELGLLEFLIATPYTQDLQHYLDIYGVVPDYDKDKGKVWPPPTEFIPYNVFDLPYDHIPDLPTHNKQEDVDNINVE